MYSPKPTDPAAQEFDGELLEGSGFETEIPATEFESDELAATEDPV